jgi:hypothetical protein
MTTVHLCHFLVFLLLLLAQSEPLLLLESSPVTNQDIFSSHRRRFLALPWLALAAPTTIASAQQEQFNEGSSFHLEVTVSLPREIDSDLLLGPDTALYVTARPTTAEMIPPDALQGGGRIPPVLSARSVDRTMTVVLSDNDRTQEGTLWDTWKSLPLAVSARLDTDGIAATRNSTDLVGRAIAVDASKGSRSITIPLQGRGLAGKLLTK